MEFGRSPMTELDKVDFTLPQEPSKNSKVLPGGPADGKLYVGMPRWGRTEWVGKIYPKKTKEKDFLAHYLNHFNSVEVRHQGWFAKPEVQEEMFEILSSLNIGAVITETAGRRDCAHMNLPIPKTMIRIITNDHYSDINRIAQWGSRIKLWLDHGIEEVYFCAYRG